MEKRDILIACPPLDAGGVTASLLALLHSVDYEKYNIDLIPMRLSGEYLDMIPQEVTLLEPALSENIYWLAKMRKLFSYMIRGFLVYRFFYKRTRGKSYKNGDFQLMSGLARSNTARRLKKRYYAAVGYMEGFENAYIVKKVQAEKKIGYVHVDYINAGLDPVLDRGIFKKLDNIVLVSQDNKAAFERVFPEFAEKTAVVENIILEDTIRERAKEPPEDFKPGKDTLNIVTAARLVIKHKGLDRAVKALARLRGEGYAVKWYVFGEGEDKERLRDMIREYSLEEDFVLMGGRKNVYPYVVRGDLFALPSRYEGKPIAVIEAQILLTVPVVTEYASAREQIEDNVDGLVLENSDEAIYYGIKRILDEDGLLERLRGNLKKKKLNCREGLRQFCDLLEKREGL